MPKSKKSDLPKVSKSKSSTSTGKATKTKKSSTPKETGVGKRKPPATKVVEKKPAAKAAKSPKKKPAPSKPSKRVEPRIALTPEEIQLRAYYIAERRAAMGWAGDSTSDWVEAEAQLRDEKMKAARI